MEEFLGEPCTTELYELGECCRFDEVRGELSWVDVLSGRFFRARVRGRDVEIVRTYELGGFVTALAPLEDRAEGWIVAKDQSIFKLSEDGELSELAAPEAHQRAIVRTNDGAADPWGQFWVGSMAFDAAPGRGSLYRFHETSGVKTVLRGVTISNGVGWSPDATTMYYVDSGPGTIKAFELDHFGDLGAERLFASFDVAREGTPDGLCVDRDGSLWVAMWGGYEVRRYSPSGEQQARVALPTAQPSSCAIGGPGGTTLYVTTAQEDMTSEQLAAQPDAGRLFCVDVHVEGLALGAYRPGPGGAR